MKRYVSLIACVLICMVLVTYRVANSDLQSGQPPLKITLWDACGYYLYLPSTIIYKDFTQLQWLDSIDRKYKVTGGNGWQAEKADNGNYVFKYEGGVALMQLPFFLIAHFIAGHSHYPADGYSPPYQYALGFGVIFYCFLAILLLRNILLRYYSDTTTAITLLLLCLATNFIQYAAVDSGQSHCYLFPLYVLAIYASIRWHARPSVAWAAAIGYIVGLTTMTRPTDAIILFIPLFWATHNKEAARAKWAMVKAHKSHIAVAIVAGLLGVLPQLLYWKAATGSFIYELGSKWDFLNPHFRVLLGWEKGWFIYTPVTILFIAGLFFIRKYPFRKSVLWYCLLNIYIIIAWSEWRYGGSYSTRALVQSYPAFALPLGALVQQLRSTRWKVVFFAAAIYLTGVNLFQITQYCKTIIHFDDMNRKYYGAVYLNPSPTALDMSLLDVPERLNNEKGCIITPLIDTGNVPLHFDAGGRAVVAQRDIMTNKADNWLKIEAAIKAPDCLWQSYLNAEIRKGDSVINTRVRLFSPISANAAENQYAFYMHLPPYFMQSTVTVYLSSAFNYTGTLQNLRLKQLSK